MDQSVQSRIDELNEQNSILMNKIKSAEEIALQNKMELEEKNAETAKLSVAEKNAQSTSTLLNNQIEKYRDNINDCQNKLQQLQSGIDHYVNLVNRKKENEQLQLSNSKLNKQLSECIASNDKVNEKQLTINRLVRRLQD
jgi:chromosome segregation ATPase